METGVPGSGGVTSFTGPEEATVRDSGCLWLCKRRQDACNLREEGIYGLDLCQHSKNREEDPSLSTATSHRVPQTVYVFKSFQRGGNNSFN